MYNQKYSDYLDKMLDSVTVQTHTHTTSVSKL